jgi:hypothetical protein
MTSKSRNIVKITVCVLSLAVIVIAQQPVSQGPQAGNAAAWLTNLAQVNAVTVLTGTGATGTGSQRVTVAEDANTIAGSAVGTAGTPSANVVSIQGVSSGTAVAVSGTFNPTPQAGSTYAFTATDVAATAATNVKGSAGNVYGFYGYNPNTATCFLQFYNSASAVLGTNALHPIGVLAGGTFVFAPGSIASFNLSTAISTGEATTATGGTGCSSAMPVTILYQ